jgi:hypothetical protein
MVFFERHQAGQAASRPPPPPVTVPTVMKMFPGSQ